MSSFLYLSNFLFVSEPLQKLSLLQVCFVCPILCAVVYFYHNVLHEGFEDLRVACPRALYWSSGKLNIKHRVPSARSLYMQRVSVFSEILYPSRKEITPKNTCNTPEV